MSSAIITEVHSLSLASWGRSSLGFFNGLFKISLPGHNIQWLFLVGSKLMPSRGLYKNDY